MFENLIEKGEQLVLDSLANSLRNTLKKIANATHVDKNLIKEVVRDIQRAMIQADVNDSLAFWISDLKSPACMIYMW